MSCQDISPLAAILRHQGWPFALHKTFYHGIHSTEDPRMVSCPPTCCPTREQARPATALVRSVGCCGLRGASFPLCAGPGGSRGLGPASAVWGREAFPFRLDRVCHFCCARTCSPSLSLPFLLPSNKYSSQANQKIRDSLWPSTGVLMFVRRELDTTA